MSSNRKQEKKEQKRQYRSMWPNSRKRRHAWKELDKQSKCNECKTRHPSHIDCPTLPRVIVIK